MNKEYWKQRKTDKEISKKKQKNKENSNKAWKNGSSKMPNEMLFLIILFISWIVASIVSNLIFGVFLNRDNCLNYYLEIELYRWWYYWHW